MQDNNIIDYTSRQIKVDERNYLIHDSKFAIAVFALK